MSTGPLSLLAAPAPSAGPRPLPETQVLRALWRQTDDSQRWISAVRIRQAVRLPRPAFAAAIQSLAMEALVRRRLGLQLALTSAGVAAARAAAFQQEDALADEAPARDIHPAAEATPPASREPAFADALSASLSHGLLGASAAPAPPVVPMAAPPPPHAEDDDLDLRLLCQAIGLDPEELNGHAGQPPAPPAAALAAPVPAPAPAPALSPVPPPVSAALPQSAAALSRLLVGLILEVSQLGLQHDDEAEAEAEIATSTAQLLSPRPKPAIIAASLSALLAVLEGAGPRLSPDLQAKLTQVRLFLSQLKP